MDVICKQLPQKMSSEQIETSSQEEKRIVCGYCSHHVTDPSKQIAINDSFYHLFANPHGYVFEIGCFSQATGCQPASGATDEFSWFMGYSWKIGVCRNCTNHLGWIFLSDSTQFYGLILEKLNFY